ncbi:hypothetical protein EC968_000150 [Mortierella alpina]|nr:hypothetical protein EC968_000150 [Mortierella alpina]
MEIAEPFSEGKRLKGLFGHKAEDQQREQNKLDQSTPAHSSEPNAASCHAPLQKDQVIAPDVLLREVERLALHEFGQPGKHAPFPSILEPLYQRLYDYHICLKNARKKLAAVPKSRLVDHAQLTSVSLDTLHPSSRSTADFLLTPNDTPVDFMRHTPGSPSEPSELEAALLLARQSQARVLDLERQLFLSRGAHHALLKEHILNLQSVASSPFPGPDAIAARISATDSNVMKNVLAAVVANARSLIKPLPSNSAMRERHSDSNPGQKQLPGHSEADMVVLLPSMSNTPVVTLESDRSFISGDPQAMLNEATTRLLCAETELGMLMLVMAQNTEDIRGLEEEVLRKQKELTHHRQLFAHLIEAIPLGFEAQIQEAQLETKELSSRIRVLEGEKMLAEKMTRALEEEVQGLMKRLSEMRETQERREQEEQNRVQALESTIENLRLELAFQDFRVLELSELDTRNRVEASLEGRQEANEVRKRLQGAMEQAAEEGQHMLDHLEKQHKKKTADLYACLVKAQKTNKRLHKELSTLAVKIVRVEALNDELSDQATKEREKYQALREEATLLRKSQRTSAQEPASIGAISASPVNNHDFESQTERKARITALEIQIEELTSNLRLKDIELEQAQEQIERLTLQLEKDLALQKQAHQEEMQRFSEEKKLQAQRERTCTAASVTVFQNMATKLQNELAETQEKLRDTTLCWGHTKELLQKCEQAYRRRKKDLEETTKNLHEVEETVVKLSDAIGLLEMEKEANMALVRTLEEKDREMRDMEYRLRVLEEERE